MLSRRTTYGCAALLVAWLGLPSTPVAADGAGFSLENDFIVAQDFWYTHGLAVFADADVARVEGLSLGASLAQRIYTPREIRADPPSPRDVPYAASLLVSLRARWRLGAFALRGGVGFGTLGPRAQGERTQTRIHQLLRIRRPRGWEAQLDLGTVAQAELGGSVALARPLGALQGFFLADAALDAGHLRGGGAVTAALGFGGCLSDGARRGVGPLSPAGFAPTRQANARVALLVGGTLVGIASDAVLDARKAPLASQIDRRGYQAFVFGSVVFEGRYVTGRITQFFETRGFDAAGTNHPAWHRYTRFDVIVPFGRPISRPGNTGG